MKKKLNLVLNNISLLLIVTSSFLLFNATNYFMNNLVMVIFASIIALIDLFLIVDIINKLANPLSEKILNAPTERRLFFLSWTNLGLLLGIFLSNYVYQLEDVISLSLPVYFELVLGFVSLFFIILLFDFLQFKKQGKFNKFYSKDLFLRWSLFISHAILLLYTLEIVLFSQQGDENYMVGSFMFMFTTGILFAFYCYLMFYQESIFFYLSFGRMHIGPKRGDYLSGLALSEQITILDSRENIQLIYAFLALDIVLIGSFFLLCMLFFLA